MIMLDTTGYSITPTTKSTLWLWNWRQGDLQKLSQDNPINAISVSPDGLLFATAEGNEDDKSGKPLGIFQVRIWDARTGDEIKRIPQPDVVHDVAFSSDGRFIAVKLADKVLVYQTRDWSQLQQFDLDYTPFKINKLLLDGGTAAFGINNRLVVSGQSHATRIWGLDGEQQSTLRHKAQFPRFKLSANGRYLAIQDNEALRLWDIETGKEKFRANIKASDYAFSGLDGETLVANVDGKLLRMRWKPKELIAEACRRFTRNMSQDEWNRFFDPQPLQATCKGKALTSEKS